MVGSRALLPLWRADAPAQVLGCDVAGQVMQAPEGSKARAHAARRAALATPRVQGSAARATNRVQGFRR